MCFTALQRLFAFLCLALSCRRSWFRMRLLGVSMSWTPSPDSVLPLLVVLVIASVVSVALPPRFSAASNAASSYSYRISGTVRGSFRPILFMYKSKLGEVAIRELLTNGKPSTASSFSCSKELRLGYFLHLLHINRPSVSNYGWLSLGLGEHLTEPQISHRKIWCL